MFDLTGSESRGFPRPKESDGLWKKKKRVLREEKFGGGRKRLASLRDIPHGVRRPRKKRNLLTARCIGKGDEFMRAKGKTAELAFSGQEGTRQNRILAGEKKKTVQGGG